nr:laccase domain-containing protein [Thiolinea sp.]
GGVLERTVQALQCDPARLLVWLGPAIGPAAFEVGEEVRTAFMAHDRAAAAAFVPGAGPGKWWCDIYRLARQRLAAAGIVHSHVSGGDCCTVQDVGRFFSYRRDGTTGRMASLVWFS